jgi:FlaA1/EpsC-like NDP-sugar epimerase
MDALRRLVGDNFGEGDGNGKHMSSADMAGVADSAEPRGLRLARRATRVRTDLPLAVLDALLAAAAFGLVMVARFDGDVPIHYWNTLLDFLPITVVTVLVANWMWGLYGQLWRHASIAEARRVLASGGTTAAVLMIANMMTPEPMPISVVLLGSGLAMGLTGTLRFHSRLFAFKRHADDGPGLRIVVVGASETGAAIVREMLRSPSSGLRPVALVDDDPRKQGLYVLGVRVVGSVRYLAETVAAHEANQVLLAVPSASRELVKEVAAQAEAAHVLLKVLPDVKEFFGGQPSVRDVRDLRIEDLLGREQVVTDLDAVRDVLVGRVVLVTGAGGSIGSEICRQVAACGPAKLLMLDHDETHLHDIAAVVGMEAVQVLADIRDRGKLERIFARHRPEVVFHAAAHKHVPLLEGHPCEAVKTNVGGTGNLTEMAARFGVKRFVFISTDKAVRPSSTMGATKRLGEQLIMGLAPAGTKWTAVRFGNVLGSRGSVIPTFSRQIAQGGPVTVTDPDMTRFFMSVQEAVQLVLQAAALAEGGEVFMLDMGEAVNILELAERMIRLTGRTPGIDIEVKITGTRPGEKLVEELRAPLEEPYPTLHPSIVRLFPQALPAEALAWATAELVRLANDNADTELTSLLFDVAGDPTDDEGVPAVIDLRMAHRQRAPGGVS